MHKYTMPLALPILWSAAALSASAYARDGDFSTGFQTQGRQRVPISAPLGAGLSAFLAQQANGQIVIATSSDAGIGGNPDFYVKRLNADGSADTTFAGTGEQKIAFERGGDNSDYLNAIAIQSDNKILVAGTSDGDPSFSASACAVVRLNVAGALDSTFAGSGSKIISFSVGANPNQHADRCESVSVQQDGKILLAGAAQNGNGLQMALARVQANGAIDSTFISNIGSNGKLTLNFGPNELGGIAYRARELPGGGILVIGEEIQQTGPSTGATGWGIAKLHADGSPDTSFGTGGYVFYSLGLGGDSGSNPADETPYDFAALADDSFVVVGGAPTGSASAADMAIVKFTASGAVDTSWGVNGRQILAFDFGGSNNDVATSIVRDAQGRFVIGGYVNSTAQPNSGYSSDMMVVRLLADGSIDDSFGLIGTRDVQLSPPPMQNFNQQAGSIAIAADGGILIGGGAATTVNGGPYAIGVAKLIGDTIFADGYGG